MSDQDRFDWDDDLDFENLADEQDVTEPVATPEQDFIEEEALDPPAMDLGEDLEETPKAVKPVSRKSLGLSGPGWGIRFALLTLVGAFGLGGGVIYATKIDPLTLWQPEGLFQVDQWFNFETYPLNALYLLLFGVILLAVLGGLSVGYSMKKASARHARVEGMLDKLVDLRLDNEQPWQDAQFKADPRVAAFVAETLGSWRLQMAREKKNSGQEGEMRRLQKALDSKVRDDLVGQYDNPFVASLADSVLQLFDENQAGLNEIKNVRDKDSAQSEELMALVHDARSWNSQAREKLIEQNAPLDKLVGQLSELARRADALAGDGQQSAISAAVSDITREVQAWSHQEGGEDKLATLNELVDKGSKLAFQIAMEVARLGTRGERMLPMTQSLEELTTEFRQATTDLAEANNSDTAQQIMKRLDQVQARLDKGPGSGAMEVAEQAQNLVGSTNHVQQNLQDMTQSFGNQSSRLDHLGSRFGEFTGVDFDPAERGKGNPDNPPEGGLLINQHDPFGQTVLEPEKSVAEVDPFSNSGGDTALTMPPTPPVEEEKVHDLAEFGAVRIDESGDSEDRVYEMSEFGAVALT